jgi:hypothetical protein
MRVLATIGLGLVLIVGCGGKARNPMDAQADRADGGGGIDTNLGSRAVDTASDPPQGDVPRADATDAAGSDTATPDSAPDLTSSDSIPSDSARPEATADAGADGGAADGRPADPCASNNPLTTVGCNGEPKGPAPANTLGGLCSPGDAGAASGTCSSTSHFCVYHVCALLCEPTASTEVSTGGCSAGSRCWDTGLIPFCFPDCRGQADCPNGLVCDSARGLCRAP